MASSIGFRIFSFLPSCYSSYGAWTFTPVGLSPTVHASLRWTHTFVEQSSGKIVRRRIYCRFWFCCFQVHSHRFHEQCSLWRCLKCGDLMRVTRRLDTPEPKMAAPWRQSLTV